MEDYGWWARLCDRAAVRRSGGVRVRVLPSGGGVVGGRTPGPPPERLVALVLELTSGAGTVDLRNEGHRWHVRALIDGARDPRLEQRLRNVLGNL